MFKKILTTSLFLLLSESVFAGKIVVFDIQQAVMATDSTQKSIQELQAKPEYAQIMNQAESLRADLEALQKEANSKGMTWSDEQRTDHRKRVEYIQADLKLAAQKIQAENSALMAVIEKEMQPKLEAVLTKIVEDEDIDIVLRKQVTFLAKPVVDITEKVTAELNKKK